MEVERRARAADKFVSELCPDESAEHGQSGGSSGVSGGARAMASTIRHGERCGPDEVMMRSLEILGLVVRREE